MTDDILLRLPQLRARYPRSRSAIYADVASGVLPPPCAIGRRCSAWSLREIEAVITARISGADDDAVRKLVSELVAGRQPT